jgi:uncharacterized protein (DUF1697 family)
MPIYVALLRAVNVGGTGKLPMADLKVICLKLGFSRVQTYIASGNVLFQSEACAVQVKQALEIALLAYAGKPVGVMVRSTQEMADVLLNNPFKAHAGNRVMAIFLDTAPNNNALTNIKGQKDEQLAIGEREIYVHYSDGMAQSKLQIHAAKAGTARNMNTVTKLVSLALAY